MINNNRVAVIIAARGGSKRLPRKNIYTIWGKPMIYWPIRAAHNSMYIDDVFVSTEDPEIKKISLDAGSNVIDRPNDLADDVTHKHQAILHAYKAIEDSDAHQTPDIVIALQANSPDIMSKDIDAALEKLIKYDRWEVISMDSNLLQNGAFRIQLNHAVVNNSPSAVAAAYVVD